MESNQEVAPTHQQLLFKSALTGKRKVKVEQRCLKSRDIAGFFFSLGSVYHHFAWHHLKNSNGKSSLELRWRLACSFVLHEAV